jgi:hypothetical protein
VYHYANYSGTFHHNLVPHNCRYPLYKPLDSHANLPPQMVSIKYMFIVLSADDDGEGGTFALVCSLVISYQSSDSSYGGI